MASIPNYYLAYIASSATSGGSNGLFVVPSNALGTAPDYIVNTNIGFAVPVLQPLVDGSGQIRAQLPYGVLYAAATGPGSASNLYRLDVTASSALKPQQVSSLSINNSYSCGIALNDLQNVNDPSTAYFVVQAFPGTPNDYCNAPDNYYFLVHYSDSGSTAAASVPVGNNSFVTFHDAASGALNGIVAVDTGGNLVYFHDNSFTSPKKLLSGAGAFEIISAGTDYAFLAVFPSAASTSSYTTPAALYRVDSSGAISAKLYDFQPQNCQFFDSYSNGSVIANIDPTCDSDARPSPDGQSLFFTDGVTNYDATTSVVSSYNDLLEKVPLDGSSAATQVYKYSGGAAVYPLGPHGGRSPVDILLAGFIGPNLVFETAGLGSHGDGYPGTMYSLPQTATASTAPTVVATVQNGYFGTNAIVNGEIFVGEHDFSTVTGQATDIVVKILKPDGSLVKSFDRSQFYGADYSLSGPVTAPVYGFADFVVANGYTTSSPSAFNLGGATLTRLSLADLSLTPLKSPAGAAYVFPENVVPELDDYSYPVGGAYILHSNGFSDAAAIDAAHDLFVQITNDPSTYYSAVFF